MTDKSKHANSSIIQGICPVCKNRSLTYPKNPEYGGLVCRHSGCNWKDVYYIGKSIPKSKMRGSSSSNSKSSSDILIDLTTKRRYKTGICHYCDHSKYPNGKIIDPTTDRNAIQMKNGSWKCGVCVLDNMKKLTSLLNRQKGSFT
jgi:uncharacterized protein YbaR (Trm112 family)